MSTAIETIKTELINQKTEITNKGGKVTVHNSNPTPAEITAGIKTIPLFDASAANATAEDVLKGKTFFGADGLVTTGTLDALTPAELEMVFNNYTNSTTPIDYHMPSGTLKTRPYYFSHTPTYMNLYLNDELQEIGDHSFWECENTTIMNFNDMQNLTEIKSYGLSRVKGINMANIPSCITTLGTYAFCASHFDNRVIKIPSTITSIGEYAFAGTATQRSILTNIDLTDFTQSSLPKGIFMYNRMPNVDYVIPPQLTTINQYFLFNGGAKSITIPETVSRVCAYSFGNSNGDIAENNIMKEFIFLAETPPTIETYILGPYQSRTDTKVYVPDQSLEAYKAITNLKVYVNMNIIYPMSQRP